MKKPVKGGNDMLLPQDYKKINYVDGLIWPEVPSEESADGLFYLQASPTWQYQTILLELSRQFVNYLINRSFLVYNTPFDLRIPGTGETDADNIHIFRPDIVLICNKDGGTRVGYYGPPSLVVEILSPMTGKWDRVLRLNKYEEIGIKEYWVIEPKSKYTGVFILQAGGGYGKPEVYTGEDKIQVSLFPDLLIDMNPVFAFV
jgi:Uma2 family endonuclease